MKFDFSRLAYFSYPIFNGKFASLKKLQELQKNRFNHLYRYAKRNTSFYRNYYSDFDNNSPDIENLPVVTKKILMSKFDEFLSDIFLSKSEIENYLCSTNYSESFRNDQYFIWKSSGTSGLQASFVVDKDCMAIYDNLQFQRISLKESIYKLINPLYLGDKIAYIGADNGHFAGVCSFDRWQQGGLLINVQMRIFSILDPMQKIVDELNDFQPTIIVTYPSFAISLALESKRDLDISPKIMYFGGESITTSERNYIKKVFNCDVRNSYGASEFLTMAWECDAQEMHLNTDWLILEPIDKNGFVIKDGHLSDSCLLTNLANYAQPLIRYELGDQIQLDENRCTCGCNLPRIQVLGRKDDVLYFYKNSLIPKAAISPLAISTVIEDDAHINNYQVIQMADDNLLICLADSGEYKNKRIILIKLIRQYLDSQGLQWVSVHIKHQQVSRMLSGKVKKIISKVHDNSYIF